MRAVLASVLAMTLGLSACGPKTVIEDPVVTAETQQETAKAAQEMAFWQRQYMDISTTLTGLFNQQNLGFILSPGFDDGDEAIKISFADYEAKRQDIFALVELKISALPDPDKWKELAASFTPQQADILNDTKQQYAGLPALLSEMKARSDLPALLEASKSDPPSTDLINALKAQQYEAVRHVIRAENQQIKAGLATIDNTHPDYQLQEIFYASNLAGLQDMDMREMKALTIVALEDRKTIGANIDAATDDIPNLIKKGRFNIVRMRTDLKSKIRDTELSVEESGYYDQVLVAYETYGESFDIEIELYDLDRQKAALYRSDLTGDAFEATNGTINASYQALVNERGSVINDRLQILRQ